MRAGSVAPATRARFGRRARVEGAREDGHPRSYEPREPTGNTSLGWGRGRRLPEACAASAHTPCPGHRPQLTQRSEGSSPSSSSLSLCSRKRGLDDTEGERLRLGALAPASRAPTSPSCRRGKRGGGGGIAAAAATSARVALGVSTLEGAGPDGPLEAIRLSRVAAVAARGGLLKPQSKRGGAS